MSDGTTLNQATVAGGDVIATEDVASANQQDADQSLPAADYKLPRSKLAVGQFGRDLGDVGPDNPLDTRDRAAMRVLEGILLELRLIRQVLQENLQR